VHWFDGDVRAQAVVDGRIQKPLDLCLVEGLGHGRGGSEYLAEWLPGCLRRCSAGCTTSWAFCRPTERARAGVAPLEASSGQRSRHRLNRGGDHALNRALHAVAITRIAATPKPEPTKRGAHSKAKPTVTSVAASNAASPDASTESWSHQPAPTRPPWRLTNIGVSNGLLRQYLPKGTDLRVHDAVGLAVIETKLNTRPRKILGWKTSTEVFGLAT
jgi:Transposase IS116/IS110/IS902 family